MSIRGATPERLALASKAAELHNQGYTMEQIADALQVSRSYASALYNDPDGSKARARKDSYAGRCVGCGASTSGSNGRAGAAEWCAKCSSEKLRRWTKEAVIEALQAWAREHGHPPTAKELRNSSREKYPSVSAVVRAGFLSWADAIEGAGFLRPYSGWHPGTTRWTKESMIEIIQSKAIEGFPPSSAEFDQNIRTAARRLFGSWSAAVVAAGLGPLGNPMGKRAQARRALIRNYKEGKAP